MYRIMIVIREGKNKLENLYKYLTTTDSLGNVVIYETNSISELDNKVEEMLNGDYAKKDFIVVSETEYIIDASIN